MLDFYLLLRTVPILIMAILLVILALLAMCIFIKQHIKSSILEKYGFVYDYGLGYKCAYEFQPHWVRGKQKIHYKKINNIKIKDIKDL